MKKILIPIIIIVFSTIGCAQNFWGWRAIQDSISRINIQSQSTTHTDVYVPDSTVFQTVFGLDTAKVNIRGSIHNIDTASLSNRINLKLTGTDTLSLSNRINQKLTGVDTLSLSNRVNTKLTGTDTLSLNNRINNKLSGADTLSLSNRINSKRDSILNMKDLDTAGIDVGKVIMRGIGNWVMATVSGSGGTGNLDSLSTVLKAYSDADTAKSRLYTNAQIAQATSAINTKLTGTDTLSLSNRVNAKVSWDSTYAPKKAYADARYQAKGTYLVPSDSANSRAYSALLYQAKGTYLIPSDSTANRAFSNLKYQAKGTYVIPSDTSAQRTFSDAKYQAKATYLIPSDSSAIRTYSDLRYAYKTTYGTVTITNDTVITVTHGYGAIPSLGQINITMGFNTTGISYYVDARGTTTFRIHFCIPVTGDIGWNIVR